MRGGAVSSVANAAPVLRVFAIGGRTGRQSKSLWPMFRVTFWLRILLCRSLRCGRGFTERRLALWVSAKTGLSGSKPSVAARLDRRSVDRQSHLEEAKTTRLVATRSLANSWLRSGLHPPDREGETLSYCRTIRRDRDGDGHAAIRNLRSGRSNQRGLRIGAARPRPSAPIQDFACAPQSATPFPVRVDPLGRAPTGARVQAFRARDTTFAPTWELGRSRGECISGECISRECISAGRRRTHAGRCKGQ